MIKEAEVFSRKESWHSSKCTSACAEDKVCISFKIRDSQKINVELFSLKEQASFIKVLCRLI